MCIRDSLRALGPQHHGVAPQLVDAHLKADAGAGGGLLKNHAQALAPAMGVLDAVLGLIDVYKRQGETHRLHSAPGCAG